MYKDKDKKRATTRERVKRFREKKALQGVTPDVCSICGGKGYREFEHGLIRLPCKECRK